MRKDLVEAPKHKGRRIVTWTTEEDDILREQISIHGTENWTIIASKFKDKTTRQCRRRWYTYLNSDFKKGGWSPEEDMLLCEAQKIFGNRWTEIAKVVSGRTDNAVKNRFTTLCKKRAKHEAMAKENNVANKRPFTNGDSFHSEDSSHVGSPLKKMRIQCIPDKDCVTGKLMKIRPQFAVLSQNGGKISALHPQRQAASLEALIDGDGKFEGFAKKDDPKILALVHQAELLSSLATKVNSQNSGQSLESAWKVLENFLIKSEDNDQLKDLEDIGSCSTENQPSQRQPDLYDSPSSSEYSTGSTILSTSISEQFEQTQSEMCTLHEDSGPCLQKIDTRSENGDDTSVNKIIATESINQEEILLQCAEAKNDGDVAASSAMEFSSPLQMTPLFTSFAATIPSPQFSESERHFLMKTLGIESPAPSRSTNPSQPPPCRRALVHSL